MEIAGCKKNKQKFESLLTFESLIFKLYKKFINLPVREIDNELKKALPLIGEFWNVDRIMLLKKVGNEIEPVHLWSGKEAEALPFIFSRNDYPWCTGEILQGRLLHFSHIRELPDEGKIDKESFVKSGIKAITAIPLETDGIITGSLLITILSSHKSWPPDFPDSVGLVSNIFAGAFARKNEILLQTFHRDITEDALRESEMKYRTLFEAANDATYILKGDTVIECNDKSLKMYRCTREEFIGKTPHAFSPPLQPDGESSKEKAVRFINDALNGKSLFFEWLHCRFDGTLFYVEVSLNKILLAGEVVLLAINRDINERKIAEQEKEKLEKQLRQSQKMKAIGTLAGGIAHDFNNILTALIGNAELAREEVPEGSMGEEFIKGILKASKRAKNLVKQILTFSRQSDEERSPVIISLVIKEALSLLKATIPSTINIQEEIYAKSSMVLANPTQIHQVIMNLCINAFHAMEKQGGTLTLGLQEMYFDRETCWKGLNPGLYVELSVQDTGCGIDENIIERIFEPYFTTKGHEEGTGLGLSVVHGIVKSYDGDIKVYSEPGKGTVFHVYLPVIGSGQEEEYLSSVSLPAGKGERFLVVDDEKIIVDIIKNSLERLNYKIVTFTSSIEALEYFRENKENLDLVITDQTMPGMTGLELSKEIIKIKPDIPVILCTGFSRSVNEEAAVAIGIKEFLTKPLTRKKLAETIRNILDER